MMMLMMMVQPPSPMYNTHTHTLHQGTKVNLVHAALYSLLIIIKSKKAK